MSQPSDTPETDLRVEHVTSTSFRGFIVSPNFARKLERQRDAARDDARRLAEACNKLMQCADPNINNCSDAELREAVERGFAREIIEQAEAFLETREALAAHEALTAKP